MGAVDEFRERYSGMSDNELCRLDAAGDSLTDDAQSALVAEMQSRGLVGQRRETVRAETAQWAREAALDIGDIGLSAKGVGKTFLGKSAYGRDDTGDAETFTTNLWFLILFLPVFPIGTYRIRRPRGRNFWNLRREDLTVLDKLPMAWGLAGMTFVKAVILFIAFLYLFQLLARLSFLT